MEPNLTEPGFKPSLRREVLINLEIVDMLITNHSHLLISVTPPRNSPSFSSVLIAGLSLKFSRVLKNETWVGIQNLLFPECMILDKMRSFFKHQFLVLFCFVFLTCKIGILISSGLQAGNSFKKGQPLVPLTDQWQVLKVAACHF